MRRKASRSAVRLGVLIGLLACAPGPAEHAKTPSGHPDVVILLADDLGWADVGYHEAPPEGGPRTPAIDALARSGLSLERFYAQPSCTPTRAGLLTARLPLRIGIRSNLGIGDQAGLALDERILALDFQAAGYQTALAGKWHLGESAPEEGPNARGFESFYGCLGGMIDYATHERRPGVLDWQRDGEPVEEPGYATHLIAAEAVRLIEAPRDRPLFLCVSFTAPHAPLHVPPGRTVEDGADPVRARYVAMVEELDRAVGAVVEALDRSGRRRDAIVLFASDNGGAPKSGGSNHPLRGRKFQTFEGAIRTPALFSWPGRIQAGGTTEQVVTCMDVLPTLAAAAGVALRPARPLDGESLWPELAEGRVRARGPRIFACEMPGERGYAVLDGRWKLVLRGTDGGPLAARLYDLDADPAETEDVAASNPGTLERLRAELAPWVP